MNGQSPKDFPQDTGGEKGERSKARLSLILQWFESLLHLGLGESALRIGTNIFMLLLVIPVLWLVQRLYHEAHLGWLPNVPTVAALETGPTPVPLQLPEPVAWSLDGLTRLARPHTTIPDRPRIDVSQYTVQTGDNVFSIAESFGLKPSTILLGNYNTLKNDVDLIRPGQILNILPLDGAYYEWQGVENLNSVAKYYNVDPQAILESPANHLDMATIGDPVHPNIAGGTWLVVPGGMIQFSWNAPIGKPRSGTGATSKVNGPGSCDSVTGGNVGFGTFVFPTVEHWLSGTDYRPDVRHFGVDFAGGQGNAVYAVDAGVVVYSGWANGGYGNLVIIDHGNGWQSLYAHLSQINVGCTQSVGQGDIIGLIGMTGGTSTGPHLHFEISYDMAPVNPHTVFDIPGR